MGQIPGGIASRDELRRLLNSIAGYLFVGGLPDRMADRVFDRLVRHHRTKLDARLEQEPIVERMQALLDGYCSDLDIRACAERYYEGQMENTETAAGVYTWANAVAARAFDSLPEREVFGHFDDWLAPLLSSGARDIRGVFPVTGPSVWEPVGTLSEYLKVNLDPPRLSYLNGDERAREARTRFEPDLVIGAGATIEAGASLQHVVIWDGERVPSGLRAHNGVFAGGAFHAC